MTARPGLPDLDIAPARAVVAPVGFVTARGDDADPALDGVRRGIADVRLEVFVGEQAVPFVQEIDARDFLATTIHYSPIKRIAHTKCFHRHGNEVGRRIDRSKIFRSRSAYKHLDRTASYIANAVQGIVYRKVIGNGCRNFRGKQMAPSQ